MIDYPDALRILEMNGSLLMMQLLNQINSAFKACALLDNRDTFWEKKRNIL